MVQEANSQDRFKGGENTTLVKNDFKKINLNGGKHYFAFKGANIFGEMLEIDIETCTGGFCVAIYDEIPSPLEGKICVNSPDDIYLLDILGILPRSDEVWEKALEIANTLAEKWVRIKLDSTHP